VYPNGYWHLVNIPIIAVFPVQVGGFRSDLITPLVVGLTINYFIKKYRHAWWKKYAYVMSAAFDSGTAITVTLTFLMFTANVNYQILFPVWAMNRADVENCAPDYFLTCTEHQTHGDAYGQKYNASTDDYCNSIQFGSATSPFK
ncbi:hypothetical protein HDU76_006908, partial [Blyttiomyces sp. JEL0837]